MKKYIVIGILILVLSCSTYTNKETPQPAPTSTTVTPPITTIPEGKGCEDKVVFNRDVLPIIQTKCLSCHSTFADYSTGKTLAAQWASRVNLPEDDRSRMPLAPNPALSALEKQTFTKWLQDGLIEDVTDEVCVTLPPLPLVPPPVAQGFKYDFNYVENAILEDLSATDATTRLNTRYLVITHKSNLGLSDKGINQFVGAIDKGLNGLSTAVDLFRAKTIDPAKTIFKFDLRDYKMNAADWVSVQDIEPLNFESFTTRGLQIKALTGTRKAWLHAENYLFSAYGGQDATVYYNLLKIPSSLSALQTNLQVDFAGSQQGDFQASFLGFFGSPISLNKNRLIVRVPSNDGYYWQTFDTNSKFVETKNLFQFPLLADSGGTAIFTPDASEVIFTLPNKLQAYALFNSAGNRLNEAALDIVFDNQTHFDPTIRNAFSCLRCHNQGLIQATDQIRDHIKQNGAQFTANDVSLVNALYHSAITNFALFNNDNAKISSALSDIAINSVNPDPITYALDSLRKDQNLAEVASLFFLSTDDFKIALNNSATGRQALGQLLTGGTVGFGQLTQALPQVIAETRFGQDQFPVIVSSPTIIPSITPLPTATPSPTPTVAPSPSPTATPSMTPRPRPFPRPHPSPEVLPSSQPSPDISPIPSVPPSPGI